MKHADLTLLLALNLGGMLTISCGDSDSKEEPAANGSLIHACIRATACDVKRFPSVHNCLENYQDLIVGTPLGAIYDDLYRCANRSTTCQAVQACFGQGEVCDRTYRASCNAERASYCDLIDKKSYVYDCASKGLACQVDPQFLFDATCQGSAPSSMSLTSRLDCTDSACQITDQSCSGDELNRCQGEKLRVCLEKKWIDYDCHRLGLGPCQDKDLGWARCTGLR